ncbi:MAG: methyltransferase domain-containing protein [Chloroflexi bacterium]|nr:methyltransferase domain-containing protein [Chloroflexota bacterium]
MTTIHTAPGLAGTADPIAVAGPRDALRCRFCAAPLTTTFVDLGMSPLCERFLAADQLDEMEPFYPLHVRICDVCLLVQLPGYVPPEEIFGEYAYFSSYSDSWVEHARVYSASMHDRLGLDATSLVVEVASNDGYLLQHFVTAGIPVLGIEPARNVAARGIERGVPVITEFFGLALAERLVSEGRRADLLIANNVLAHVPDLNDFVAGLRCLLAVDGVLTLEFPHLMRLVEGNQFDTIYHEHYSYFTFLTAQRVLTAHGLTVFDVEELSTHGGSLRLFVGHDAARRQQVGPRVAELLAREAAAGYLTIEGYAAFERRVHKTKQSLLGFLIDARRRGASVAGYGAPGKGNTLLNFCAIRTDFLDYTVDRNPYKHGRFLPGTHIPIHPPERLAETRPDYVFILPWNLRAEIGVQLEYVRDWGGRLVVPIPALEVF